MQATDAKKTVRLRVYRIQTWPSDHDIVAISGQWPDIAGQAPDWLIEHFLSGAPGDLVKPPHEKPKNVWRFTRDTMFILSWCLLPEFVHAFIIMRNLL